MQTNWNDGCTCTTKKWNEIVTLFLMDIMRSDEMIAEYKQTDQKTVY